MRCPFALELLKKDVLVYIWIHDQIPPFVKHLQTQHMSLRQHANKQNESAPRHPQHAAHFNYRIVTTMLV